MTVPLTMECSLRRPGRGRCLVIPPQGVRRVTRLLALALKMDHLIGAGGIADYSELARLGHVSRARITQIMNLLLLAPDIQEQILFLSPVATGRDPIRLAPLQPIARTLDWEEQRRRWAEMTQSRLDMSARKKDYAAPQKLGHG